MHRAKQFLALAALAGLEALRQPILLLLTGSCVLFTGLMPLLQFHSFGEEGRLARDGGLAFQFVFGVFVTGYAACSTLARELKSGTASSVLSKPVGRGLFFAAKFAGVAGVTFVFSSCAILATVLAERVAERFVLTPDVTGYVIDWQTGYLLVACPFAACLGAGLLNYRAGRPFASTALGLLLLLLAAVLAISGLFDRMGNVAPFRLDVHWGIVQAGVLISLALILFAALALSLSVRLGTAPTLTVCSVIFLLGLMSDYAFGRFADVSRAAEAAYRILPNWQHFWVTDGLGGGGTIPWAYILRAGMYAAAYAGGILSLGALSFRYADVG